jgi:hypothetical protein
VLTLSLSRSTCNLFFASSAKSLLFINFILTT